MAADEDTQAGTAPEKNAEETSAAPANRLARLSIGVLLSLLIAVTLIPPLAFTVILLQRNNQAQQEVVTTLAEATAGSIIETVDRQLQGMLTTLRVLSTAESLQSGNLPNFYRRAKSALNDTGAYLIVMDDDANQLINTRVPLGTSLGRSADPRPILRALETGEPTISDGFLGGTSQNWVFNVALPYERTGPSPRVLVLTQDAQTLSDAMARQNLRGGWNAALVDRRGIVLGSTFLSSDIGKPFFLNEFRPDDAPARQTIMFEGEEYETITQESGLSGWEAVVWAPMETVRGPMERALRMLLIGGLAMMAIGAVVAWFLGRQIAKPIRRLAYEAQRLGAGEDVQAVASPVSEISTVSAALAQASVDRRAAENEIRFLMREVAHRSKNQLTVVSSIAKQTARNARGFAAFEDSFQKRIQGLARSTDLLIAGGVAGVELSELVEAQIEPFKPGGEGRFEMAGPRFRLSHQAAQTLGLALHELATNASKYGAFLTPNGRLTVKWTRKQGRLEIVWREFVPRLRKRAEGRGFGTEVIERMLGGALEAEIERTLHADGIEYRFAMPAERVRADITVVPTDDTKL